MINKILDIIKRKYVLNELEVGEFAQFKAKGMKFDIKAYHAEGLGHVSFMKAVGFFGLMKMDTVIIVPQKIDLPLYSYDRIYAMGNDTLIVELYDTMVNKYEFTELDDIKNKYNHIAEIDLGKHWYDSIKLPQSIAKKAKKQFTSELDLFTLEHFNSYISANQINLTDIEKKNNLSSQYVSGLLENGGPPTLAFIKMFGIEKTTELYNKILFGIN